VGVVNERDYAVVVGISRYGSLRPELEGPERDAKAFVDWLKSPEGGALPPANVEHVLSSRFDSENQALGQNVFGFQPTLSTITAAFAPIIRRAVAGSNVPRVGRRLYIYLAGHGMTPRTDPITSTNHSTLLAANCEEDVNYEGISGQAWAEWFRQSHAFEEILLFMDCCRTDRPDVPLGVITTPTVKGGRPEEVRVFYAWATQWDTRSWEQPLGNPAAKRGVFTFALLEALTEGPADEQGRLTPKGVVGHVSVRVPQLRQRDVEQMPLFFMNNAGGEIVIVPRVKRSADMNVAIIFASSLAGERVELQEGNTFTTIQTHTATTEPWSLALEPGTYVIRVNDKDTGLVVRPGQRNIEKRIDG
jgi:caspase domain-containing protein